MAAVLAGVCAAPSAAEAQRRRRAPGFESGRPLSLYGGQTLGRGSAIAAGGIFPGLFFQYQAALSQRFDLGFRADLLWGSPYSSTTIGYGIQLAMPMKLAIAQGRRVAFSLRINPDLVFGSFRPHGGGDCFCRNWDRRGRCVDRGCGWGFFDADRDSFGIGCDIGLNVGIPVRNVNIIFGASSPFHIVFLTDVDQVDVYFPIAPYGGAEVRLTPKIAVFGLGQFGFNLHAPEVGGSHGDTFLRLWGGIEVAL